MFFEGFPQPSSLEISGQRFRFRLAGDGPAVVLLHGHPQTHAMWHAVAPCLRARHRVLCVDLPGYGGSPVEAGALPLAATRDAMARRLLGLLDALGFERSALVGHDLGGHVAHRIALLAPARVRRLALLGIVPAPEAVERSDMAFALAAYRSFWFAQTHPKAEATLTAPPDAWFAGALPGDTGAAAFHPEAVADYLARLPTPDAIERLCEIRRQAASLDAASDRAGADGASRIACPLLLLWGAASAVGGWYDPAALWRDRLDGSPEAAAVPGGHFIAEENPGETGRLLLDFLARDPAAPLSATA